MAKVNYLFDVSKFEARKTADQQEFEDLHGEDLKKFFKIFHDAFAMTKREAKGKPVHFKNKNYNATVMIGNIAGLLKEAFPVHVKDSDNDRLMFSRNGKFCIYFKKLDARKRPSNVRTDYAELVAYQKTIPGGDKMPIVFVGYTVDDEWTEITGIYAVYIQDNRRVWVTTVLGDELTGDTELPVLEPKPLHPIAPKIRSAQKKTGS